MRVMPRAIVSLVLAAGPLVLSVFLALSSLFSRFTVPGQVQAQGTPTCMRAGCSGTLCVSTAAEPLATTCEYKNEYACYQQAACEVQANGECGFTQSQAFTSCLNNALNPSPTPTVDVSTSSNVPLELTPYTTTVTIGEPPVVVPITQNSLRVMGGYAIAFRFYVHENQQFEALAKELDLQTKGSYVKSTLFNPQGNRVGETAGTRTGLRAQTAGYYTVVVHTFDEKTGRVQFQAFDRESEQINVAAEVPAVNTAYSLPRFNTHEYQRIGRYPFKLHVTFPSPVTIENGLHLRYFSKDDGNPIVLTPYLYQAGLPNLWNLEQLGPIILQPHLLLKVKPFSERTIVISAENYSTTEQLFSKGYYYLFNLEIPRESATRGINFQSGFAAISISGLRADLNNDGRVNLLDYSILSGEFMTDRDSYNADLNGDFKVNLQDYSILISEFNL